MADQSSQRPRLKPRLGRRGPGADAEGSTKISVRAPSGRKPSKQAQALAEKGSINQDVNRLKKSRHERRKQLKQSSLHPRNLHQGRYDMAALAASLPELQGYLQKNPAGEDTIDFANQQAVVCLNRALLKHHYELDQWDIPAGYLCPPIPGRADYVHYAADLVVKHAKREVKHERVKMLDIGCGANLIYSLLGHKSYGWKSVGTDIDPTALSSAQAIIDGNGLAGALELRQQNNPDSIFAGVINDDDFFHVSVCNPPFFASAEEAEYENQRKTRNLQRNKQTRALAAQAEPAQAQIETQVEIHVENQAETQQQAAASNDPWAKAKTVAAQAPADEAAIGRNFGGNNGELWCEGGELAFLKRMVRESKGYAKNVGWFTALVSKQENVDTLLNYLKSQGVSKSEVVKMEQGKKISRFIAWKFKV